MADGKPGLYLFGHGASTVDPYAALYLYDSNYSQPIGTTAGNGRFSRYKNPDYDKLLDEHGTPGRRRSEVPGRCRTSAWASTGGHDRLPVIQWLHRIPYNHTYWTNWPSSPAIQPMGENGAFWAETGMLVITGLKPTGEQ